MKNIFKIYKNDLKDIFTNKVLLVIIIGLCILPSLYAWFNIKASWDPYGNTGNISVAVINKDSGAEIMNKKVNMGDELVKELKTNKDLGWKFVDRKKALEGVNSGKYYAYIEIPSNFSENLTSLVSKDIKKGTIIYTVNEKINAIAPKITSKGAITIQNEVNQTVVKTVSEVVLKAFKEAGIEIEKQLPKLSTLENNLVEVQGKFKDIDKVVDTAVDATDKVSDIIKDIQNDMPLIKDTITNSKNLSSDIKSFLNDSKTGLSQLSPILKNDLGLISEISSNAKNAVSDLIDAINKGSESAPQLIDNLSTKLSDLASSTNTLTKFLEKLNKLVPGNQLKSVIDSLNSISAKLDTAVSSLQTIKNQVANGEKPPLTNLNNLLKVIGDVNTITSSILNNFDSKIQGPISNIIEDSFKVADNIIAVLDSAEKKLPAVEDILNTTLSFSGSAEKGASFIKEKLPYAKSVVDTLVDSMKKINNSSEVNELISLLKSDVLKRSDFLKQPVDLVENRLYPIKNYGSAMAPFYTVLSLWVGILLLMSLLSTNVHGDYKPNEVYFGRGLTFLTLTIIQALIVSLGDIYFLKVQAVNIPLFILISVFTSIVFTAIVYSLVSIFGNVGKAIGVVLLVIQVAGSGGTFPIQVTPQFFQNVYPLLPFTYAISAMREAVGGIYMPNLTKDISTLAIFIVVFVIFTVFFKKPINKVTEKIQDRFNESDLTGH
ncbi:YhgE/Pip domain-containing protein [Romboutsia timonensis]|uniref:YhgE/Pip domain-containing protein n=1 Tax=Romboutsia timonensis TaxID=1776391 RepID=UPI00258403D9|nr:YhgE/Pip domain-containing protein [uncultured Romboutsia sp.]